MARPARAPALASGLVRRGLTADWDRAAWEGSVRNRQRQDETNNDARVLWSQMFSHALRLLRYDEAYLALMSNPDVERRQDGLSHFVTVVCEHGQEHLLGELPFTGMQADLESTLAFKARNALVTADMRPNYFKVGAQLCRPERRKGFLD